MKNHRELLSQQLDALNRHDIEGALAVVGDKFVNHCAIPEAQGRAGLSGIWNKLWTAFPDLNWTFEDVIAEGDRVVCRMRMRGTNSAPLHFVRMPLPPTGKAVDSEAIHIFRFESDKVVEMWAQRDEVGMLRQLGHFVGAAAET